MTPPRQAGDEEQHRPSRLFTAAVFGTFFWILMGISAIYGFRLWWNAPLNPSFVPLVGAAFAATLAFTLVLVFEYTAGPIKFRFTQNFTFDGASGPAIVWCVCFLAIVFGLYLLGLPEAVKLPPWSEGHDAPTRLYKMYPYPQSGKDPASPNGSGAAAPPGHDGGR